MKVVRHPDVLEELFNISFRIAQENEEAADRFLDACGDTFEQLAQNPLIGSVREFRTTTLKDVRLWRVRGFTNYLIFYRPIEDGVEILHVVHGKRDYKRLYEDDEDDGGI